jgi:hypothetical protein
VDDDLPDLTIDGELSDRAIEALAALLIDVAASNTAEPDSLKG